jgi:hypothetical protein
MAIVKPVQDNATALKVVNPLVKTLLRSLFYRLMGPHFMLVTFTGRRRGKQYSTPTACLRDGEYIYFTTGTDWWKNLRGGAPITMHVFGKKLQGTADVITDPQEVAPLMQALIAKIGSKRAYLLGLKVEVAEVPTLAHTVSFLI